MSSTNKTAHYELPQFVENDIFNPLVDDNDAFSKIDTALYNIANAESASADEITAVKNRVSTVEGKVTALETQNGNTPLTTSAQTISGAVNELKGREDAIDARLDVVEDDINNVNTGLKVKLNNLESDVTDIETSISSMSSDITSIHNDITAVNTDVDNVSNALATEKSDRISADNTIRSSISTVASSVTTETNNRTAADATLQSAINAETSARESADALLQSEIDELVSPSGEAPSVAEVENARIGFDGTTYPNLGTAIRTQAEDINYKVNVINDSLVPTLNSTDLWEIGGINAETGANATAATRVRTKKYLPDNVKIFKLSTNNYSTIESRAFKVMAYDIEDNFVGSLKTDLTLTTAGDENSFTVLDMQKVKALYPSYKFRVTCYAGGGASVTISEASSYYMTNALYDVVDNANMIDNMPLSTAEKIINTIEFMRGAIDATTGNIIDSSYRIYTKRNIPANVAKITAPTDRNFFIYAYNKDGTFVGEHKSDNTFVTDNTGNGYHEFDMSYLFAKFPAYNFKISIYSTTADPATLADVPNIVIKNTFGLLPNISKIRVAQYNIGKFNWGHTGGLSTDVETKIMNYKRYFGKEKIDILGLQEYTDYIDTNETYASDATLFDDVYWYKSYQYREKNIKSNFPCYYTDFTYLHTEGDVPADCIYGDFVINGKVVQVITGNLNVESSLEEKYRALDKLTNQIVNNDNVICCFDMNTTTEAQALAVKSYLENKGYKLANWGYFGFMPTDKPTVTTYRCIDNIFVKGDIEIVNAEVPAVYDDLSSDHLPIIADLVIK